MSFDLKISSGDLVLDNGDLKIIKDSEKLIQDLLKICLTEAGSNPLHPWYGSFISRSMIGSVLDENIVIQIGQSQLQNALENLKTLQTTQAKSFQKVSADELINSIVDVSIIRNIRDPRIFNVKLKVLSKGQKPITTTFSVDLI